MEEKLLNKEEAAGLLRLPPEELEAFVQKGRIPAFHLDGKYLRFRKSDLVAFRNSFLKGNEEGVERYAVRDGLHDFFYFNDFYLLSILLIFLILFAVLTH